MKTIARYFLYACLAGLFAASNVVTAQQKNPYTVALQGGKWFNGTSFEEKTMYSVQGFFSEQKPDRVDTVIDLSGAYIIPPFGEAHNHNLGTGSEDLDRKAISRYLSQGVYYVKIQGNLPITDDMKRRLQINTPRGPDVSFSQGGLTATGGMPILIVEKIHPMQGFNPGYTREQLRDFRYFIIDTEADLEKKWPRILAQKPDFIKAFLWNSEYYEKLKNDTSVFFKGLNPDLLPRIVAKAHASGLRVSAHVTTASDFHRAVTAGVDEIAHLPRFASGAENKPIAAADARLAAEKGIEVITTLVANLFQGGIVRPADRPLAKQAQIRDLKLLLDQGVTLAIGSDDIADNSFKEAFYLKELGIWDNLGLLKLWTETTARFIFPDRKIGYLKPGYEASFVALEGNPLEDFEQVRKIRLKFKQGMVLNY